jgi:hypothetical protein
MAGVGVLYGVDGEEPESVDRELVEITFRHVVSLTGGLRQARISGKSWKSAEVIGYPSRLQSTPARFSGKLPPSSCGLAGAEM